MPATFEHEALFYDSDSGYVDGLAPFVRDGVVAGEAVMCALPADRQPLLRDALGAHGDDVEWVDMVELGTNPARIIPAWETFVASHQGRGCRGVGEPVWFGRTDDELLECERHESLLNVAFGDGPGWTLLCPYDRRRLPKSVIATAGHNHPILGEGGGRWENDRYSPVDPFGRPLPQAPEGVEALSFDDGGLRDVRRFVAQRVEGAGWPAERVADLVVAADEIATNSLRYGGGAGTIAMWCTAAGVVCEVRDQGRITDPLIGRRVPEAMAVSGRGMWLANHLCDLVQLWSGDDGTVVRLHLYR